MSSNFLRNGVFLVFMLKFCGAISQIPEKAVKSYKGNSLSDEDMSKPRNLLAQNFDIDRIAKRSAHLDNSSLSENATKIPDEEFVYDYLVPQPKWPEFLCIDGKNRFTFQDMCDGHKKCDDLTDECHTMCRQTFMCTSDKKCLPLDQFCDGVVHCEDGSDELPAPDLDNDTESFVCSNEWTWNSTEEQKWKTEQQGRTCRLPTELLCDGVNHCGDHSDECNSRCADETRFFCANGRCIAAKDRCDGQDDCGDGSDECTGCQSTFQCDNGKCIPQASFCDGRTDCSDGSDEIDVIGRNTSQGVLCSNLQNSAKLKCLLPQRYVCDGYEHCYFREDECVRGCSNSFICDNGNCVLINQRCDGYDDCGDMSDEQGGGCQNLFQCDDGRFLSLDRFCDGVRDCSDGTDEITEDSENPSGGMLKGSAKDAFYCFSILDLAGHNKCKLPRHHLCDGVDHCLNRTDECQGSCNHSYFCDEEENCIAREKVCDGEVDCRDKSDEVRSTKPFPAARGFTCNVRRGSPPEIRPCVLPQEFVLDEIEDCEGGADVCVKDVVGVNSTENESPCAWYKCISDGNFTISKRQVCDGIFDCPDLSDECLCQDSQALEICRQTCFTRYSESQCPCPVGSLPCIISGQSSNDALQCINISQFCDSQYDCANLADELYCGRNKECSQSQDLAALSSGIYGRNQSEITQNWRSTKPVDNCTPNYVCPRYQRHNKWTPREAIECNGVPECFYLEDECSTKCNNDLQQPYCKYRIFDGSFACPGGAIIAGKKVCDGEIDCGNSTADEDGCLYRFYCESGPIHSIPEYRRCDLQSDCSDQSDEVGCNDTHFYCEGESPNPMYVSSRAKFDGKDDCADGSDECPSTFASDSLFSSKEKMIENTFLNVMVWVMGILSVIGNTAVFIYTCRNACNSRNKLSNIATIYNYLVLNLAIADLIMGLFLLSLAAQSVSVSGSYCRQDKIWRSGSTCNVLGIMAAISAESSIAMLAILSSYRLSCVARPIKSREFQLRTAAIIASLAWTVSIILAIIPVIPDLSNYFVTHVWLSPNPYFGADVVKRGHVKVFMNNLDSYIPDETRLEQDSGFEWGGLDGRLSQLDQSYKVLGYFGYYSTHAVCLSKIFVSYGDAAWQYSVAITTTNFLVFIYIVVAYALMWSPGLMTRNTTKVARTGQATRNMQKRIAVLVASDFACWVPTCMIAFLRLAGVDISDTVYALAAIILLPINSALNPILYSNAIQHIIGSVTSFIICCKRGVDRDCIGREDMTAVTFARKNSLSSVNAETENIRLHLRVTPDAVDGETTADKLL